MKIWKTMIMLLIAALLVGCPASTGNDTHTVTFNSNSGSAVASQQVAEGSSVTEPTAPTRSGYAFGGWYTDSGLSNAWTFGSDTVNSDITLYAKWAIATISVQSGTFQMGNTDSEADSDERAVHSVTVDSFLHGRNRNNL